VWWSYEVQWAALSPPPRGDAPHYVIATSGIFKTSDHTNNTTPTSTQTDTLQTSDSNLQTLHPLIETIPIVSQTI